MLSSHAISSRQLGKREGKAQLCAYVASQPEIEGIKGGRIFLCARFLYIVLGEKACLLLLCVYCPFVSLGQR